MVFTASQKVYADVLLDLLDPQKTLISHRLFRDSCLLVHGNYLKDLSVLQRDMKTVRIIYIFVLFYSHLFWRFLSGTFSSFSNFFLVMCCFVYSVLFHPILFLIFILFLLLFFSNCIIQIFDNFFYSFLNLSHVFFYTISYFFFILFFIFFSDDAGR